MGQVIVEFDIAILRYMQPDNTTPHQYVGDLVSKSCKVADVYDEGTLDDVFIEKMDSSFQHRLRH